MDWSCDEDLRARPRSPFSTHTRTKATDMAWEKSVLHQKGCQLAADPRAEAVTDMEGSSAMTKMDHRHQRSTHTPKESEPITLLILYNSIQDKGTHNTIDIVLKIQIKSVIMKRKLLNNTIFIKNVIGISRGTTFHPCIVFLASSSSAPNFHVCFSIFRGPRVPSALSARSVGLEC